MDWIKEESGLNCTMKGVGVESSQTTDICQHKCWSFRNKTTANSNSNQKQQHASVAKPSKHRWLTHTRPHLHNGCDHWVLHGFNATENPTTQQKHPKCQANYSSHQSGRNSGWLLCQLILFQDKRRKKHITMQKNKNNKYLKTHVQCKMKQ